ncbi:MAG TPA: hypothetical protein VJ927_03200 [Actinomycetota bacterium]|nr:hypothetical protein [Actinomycetota bacterium]
MMLIGIALLVGGMAVSVGAPFEAREARLLADRGIETIATITAIDIRGGGRNSSPYAVADVAFQDEFGLRQEPPGIIYCGEPEDISVGDEVEITYDPEEVAPPQFTECPQSQEITIPLVIGAVVIAAGTLFVLRAWWARGWRKRWWGIAILVLGIGFTGTSFEEDCRCQEMVYTGVALIVIGTVPLVAPRVTTASGGPPDPGATGQLPPPTQ